MEDCQLFPGIFNLHTAQTVSDLELSLDGGAGGWCEVHPGGGNRAAHGHGGPRDDGADGRRASGSREGDLRYEKNEYNTLMRKKSKVTCVNTVTVEYYEGLSPVETDDHKPGLIYHGRAGNPREVHPGGVQGVDRVCDEPKVGKLLEMEQLGDCVMVTK